MRSMMAAGGIITVFLCSLVLVCSLTRGEECPPPTIRRVATGQQIKSKPEWKVVIRNPCVCTDINLQLTADPNDFSTVVPIDPSILSKDKSGAYWIVNNGDPLYGGTSFTFTYAGDPVNFSVFHFAVACSSS